MIRYLLDTNILSYATKNPAPIFLKLRGIKDSEAAISSVTWYEIMVGLGKIKKTSPAKYARLKQSIDAMIGLIQIMPFDKDAAEWAAKVRNLSVSKGINISVQDSLIAGHAISKNLILISHDRRACFDSVKELGLTWEDWATPTN